jgi:hypothetical protein
MDRSSVSSSCTLVYVALTIILVPPSLAEDNPKKPTPRGLVRHDRDVAPGYTLFSPFSSKSTFLIDADGKVVHQWESRYNPGLAPYLLPNGNLLRGIQVGVKSQFEGGGISGGLQEFRWDGKLLWEFHVASDLHYYHHDIEPLPNGNILMIAWEAKTKQEVLDAGRRPDYASDKGLWPEAILEIEPLRPYGARVVWQWHVWDHLIQDTNPQLPNYGVIREHPERVDINADIPRADNPQRDAKNEEQQAADRRRRERTDWLHFNGVDYNAELDQILVSSPSLSEIWIIDHSTTTEEAAGSSGGGAGRGGDLLYRWGNPQSYRAGMAADQRLFHQHDPQWIPAGSPGEGHITIFNNGADRSGGENYSTVVEIETPIQADGTYKREDGKPFLPLDPCWEYNPNKEARFFANFISGAHRLANGNTLICSGPDGRVLEVRPDGTVVWEYRNPFASLSDNGKLDERSFSLFRATRIPPDHPALRGKTLAPLDPQPKTAEMILAERPKPPDAAPGWQPLDGPTGSSRWVHVNGEKESAFRTQPDADNDARSILKTTGKSSGILRSDRMVENFIVEFEWKIVDKQADAGLLIWADALPAIGARQPCGIEIEICDRGNSTQSTSHGDIVASQGAEMSPDPRFRVAPGRSMPHESDFHVRPAGEWNHYRVTAVDGSVTVEVNGHLVSGGSRCAPSKGYVCLVSERGEVHFRNPRLWELPTGSHAADAGRTAQGATSHRSLYNRVNLDNWKVLSGDWKSEDWRLTCGSSPGEIEVELGKDVEHLFFDFKRAGDSAGARTLPFRIGDLRFAATNADAGEWNRIHVDFTDSEVRVTFSGSRQVASRDAKTASRLTLVNDGVATEFSNVFVRSK